MKAILNLGSGTKNLLPNHYKVHGGSEIYTVVNVDIIAADHDIPSGFTYVKIETGGPLPGNDATTDIVLAISPYNFSVITTQTLRILRPKGAFIIVGSRSNPWVSKPRKTEADSLHLVEKVAENDCVALWRLAHQIKNTYQSRLTDGNVATPLTHIEIWRRK